MIVLNIWNKHDFQMSGLGERFFIVGFVKHFFKCIKWSWQRATRGFADRDIWSMCDYIQKLMPVMLKHLKENRFGSPGTLGVNYVNDDGYLVNDACHAEWDAILDRMIFLWKELDPETCSIQNEYADAHAKAFSDFADMYGFFGERLQTDDEMSNHVQTGGITVHFMNEVPGFKEIDDKYMGEESRLYAYRIKCKDEIFDLTKKYFFDLVD